MRLVFCLSFLLLYVTAPALARVPGPLVTPEWLADNLKNVVILDVRDEPKTFSAEGHIPGSVFVPWSSVRSTVQEDGVALDDMLPPPDVFANLMRKSGVRSDSSIVIASRGLTANDLFLQTRLYWQLRYYGHDDVAVLDGGVAAWAIGQRPLTRRSTKVAAGNWSARGEVKELLARTPDVEQAAQSRSAVLADARPVRSYLGLDGHSAKVSGPGHVPGAKHFDSSLFVIQGRPARFRAMPELRQLVAGLGLDTGGKPIITYCETGDWASGTWFVLHELLGYKTTSLYDGSMHAWTKNQNRPRTQFKME